MAHSTLARLASYLLALGAVAAANTAHGQLNPNWPPQMAGGSPAPSIGLYSQPGVIASGGVGNADMPPSAGSNKGDCTAGRRAVKGAPKVVGVFPANGAVVRPGIVVVRVTFDRPMSCDASFAGNSNLPNPCPGAWREAFLSQDGRSFRTVCEVAADTRYRMVLHSFRSANNVMASPYTVTFSTSGSAPIGSVREALAQDTGAPATAGG